MTINFLYPIAYHYLLYVVNSIFSIVSKITVLLPLFRFFLSLKEKTKWFLLRCVVIYFYLSIPSRMLLCCMRSATMLTLCMHVVFVFF